MAKVDKNGKPEPGQAGVVIGWRCMFECDIVSEANVYAVKHADGTVSIYYESELDRQQ